MKKIKKFLRFLGPGYITGASDDDPAGIATYSQAGAMFGFSQAWTSLFSFPLMTAVQEMCGRIGLVTGKGLAGIIKTHFGKPVLYIAVSLLFIANTINIGANLGAMASSLELVFSLPSYVWLVVIVVICLCLEIFFSYKLYANYLKYLTFALLAYVATAFIVGVDWQEVLVSLVIPHILFSKEYIINIVAILGTTISPYLFFWQASEEVEEEVSAHKIKDMGVGIPLVTKKDLSFLRVDTIFGMFFSNLIMFFIIITTGATLHKEGIFYISSAVEAATALRPLAGDYAFLLFALGIIGTGFLSIPVLAGATSYAVSEAFGWKEGLYKKLRRAKAFYAVIVVSVFIGFCMNFIGFNPISALYFSAVINGLTAPFLLLLVLLIANRSDIMNHHKNGIVSNSLGIITFLVMSISAIILLITMVY